MGNFEANLWNILFNITGLCCHCYCFDYLERKQRHGIKNKMKNGIGGPEASGGGQFGTSRWQTEKERDANNSVWKYEKEPIKTAGIVLGADLKKKKVWLVSEDEHTLIIGTTGSGKTRRIIYPAIWTLAKAGESMILTDPKGGATRS
jgi:type IV secretion system protein VirD4